MKSKEINLLNVGELAALLKVKAGTIYEWVDMGHIPYVDIASGKKKRCLRFNKGNVLQWLEARESKGRVNRIP